MKQYKSRNLVIYYLWKFVSGIYFVFPITVIFILSRGISKEEVTIFLGATTIMTLLLEIPTGYIADRFSRKLSVSLGFLFNGIGHLLFIYLGSFWQLLLIAFLFALNRSLISGAMESLIYDNLLDSSDKKSFIKLSSRGGSVSLVSSVIATIVGAYMFTYDKNLPFVATALVNLVLATLIMFFKESKRTSEVIKNINAFDGLREVLKNKSVLPLIMINVLAGGISSYFYTLAFHPRLFDLGMSAKYIGWLDAFNSLLLVFVLGFLTKLVTKNEKVNLFVYTMIPLIAFAVALFNNSPFIIITFGLLFTVMWSSRSHIVSNIQNALIGSKNRSLTLSSINLIESIGTSIAVPLYGMIIVNSLEYTKLLIVFVALSLTLLIRRIKIVY